VLQYRDFLARQHRFGAVGKAHAVTVLVVGRRLHDDADGALRSVCAAPIV
jgi:hypothetical protein